MTKGTVKVFYPLSGFGYIDYDEGKNEYCFYKQDIRSEGERINKGDLVDFDIYKGHGVRAINIVKCKKIAIKKLGQEVGTTPMAV